MLRELWHFGLWHFGEINDCWERFKACFHLFIFAWLVKFSLTRSTRTVNSSGFRVTPHVLRKSVDYEMRKFWFSVDETRIIGGF